MAPTPPAPDLEGMGGRGIGGEGGFVPTVSVDSPDTISDLHVHSVKQVVQCPNVFSNDRSMHHCVPLAVRSATALRSEYSLTVALKLEASNTEINISEICKQHCSNQDTKHLLIPGARLTRSTNRSWDFTCCCLSKRRAGILCFSSGLHKKVCVCVCVCDLYF